MSIVVKVDVKISFDLKPAGTSEKQAILSIERRR